MKIKRLKITIRNPFYGAGTTYGWKSDGYDIWGVGIKLSYVASYDSLDIVLDGNTYRVSTEKIKEFVKKYDSFYKVKHYKVVLAVFSKSLLRKISK